MYRVDAKSSKAPFDVYADTVAGKAVLKLYYKVGDEDIVSISTEKKVVKSSNLHSHLFHIAGLYLPEQDHNAFVNLADKYLSGLLYSLHVSGGPESYAQQIPGLFDMVKNPVSGNMSTIHSTIIDLNDARGWTREQIADWLETLDNNPIIEGPKEEL